jgi:hypothetical protein
MHPIRIGKYQTHIGVGCSIWHDTWAILEYRDPMLTSIQCCHAGRPKIRNINTSLWPMAPPWLAFLYKCQHIYLPRYHLTTLHLYINKYGRATLLMSYDYPCIPEYSKVCVCVCEWLPSTSTVSSIQMIKPMQLSSNKLQNANVAKCLLFSSKIVFIIYMNHILWKYIWSS